MKRGRHALFYFKISKPRRLFFSSAFQMYFALQLNLFPEMSGILRNDTVQ